MQFKDYYDILGLKPEASATEIKAAYRRLARKFHPDVSKEKDAEERFKGVSEAYEALHDPKKRAAYDQLRRQGYRPGEEFRPPPDFNPGFEFSDRDGDNAGFSDFFESLFGRNGPRQGRAGPRRGQDSSARVAVDLETVHAGGKQRLVLREPGGGERVLEVKIPPGIQPGQQIRLAGQGQAGRDGGPAGDLLLEIEYRPHARFAVEGRNINFALAIAPWEAALGATINVPTLAGVVELKIPPGSNTGRKLRLKGRGLPGATAGDQIVTLEVHTPPASDDAQKSFYENMRREFNYDPRQV